MSRDKRHNRKNKTYEEIYGKDKAKEIIEKQNLKKIGLKRNEETTNKISKSNILAWKIKRHKKSIVRKICLECNIEFETNNNNRKFHNRKCAIERQFLLNGKFFDGKYKNILIEIDCPFWHDKLNAKINDEIKDQIVQQNNYKIYRIIVNNESHVSTAIKENKKLLLEIFGEKNGS